MVQWLGLSTVLPGPRLQSVVRELGQQHGQEKRKQNNKLNTMMKFISLALEVKLKFQYKNIRNCPFLINLTFCSFFYFVFQLLSPLNYLQLKVMIDR